jgi:methylated-DNA-[protein]-cysteine S-methyltransferase
MPLIYKWIDSSLSAVGRLRLAGSDAGLAGILWATQDPADAGFELDREDERHPVLIQAARELREYFAGHRRDFSVPLDLRGTEFQNKVWHALRSIPFGETRSYGELASQIGAPKASRAVGAANGRNPIPIILPCHRVIGSSGSLTGFGGGLPMKRELLAHEQSRDQLSLELA